MKLWGKAQKAPTPKEALGKLKETLDMLQKREDYLQTKVQKELVIAKQNATKNKRTALAALKRKRAYESQMEKMAGARSTIETQVIAMENMSVAIETLTAMKMASKAMAGIHNNMKIEDVDDTMEEISEQMAMANEINDAISQPIGEQVDEEELEEELRKLEEENLDEQFLQAPAEPAQKLEAKMPSVPSTIPTAPVTAAATPKVAVTANGTTAPSGGSSGGGGSKSTTVADDDDFKALEASMG